MAKEVFVKHDMLGNYCAVSSEEAVDLVTNKGYDVVVINADDTVINLVEWTIFGFADEDDMREAVNDYMTYVSSITGMELPRF